MASRLVDMYLYIGIEDRDQSFNIPALQRCEKRVNHSALFSKIWSRKIWLGKIRTSKIGTGKIGARIRFSGLNPAPRAAGQLPRSFWRSIEDRSNLIERDREHIVQYESQTLVRIQTIKHHKQRDSHRIGKQSFLFRVAAGRLVLNRTQVCFQWLLGAG